MCAAEMHHLWVTSFYFVGFSIPILIVSSATIQLDWTIEGVASVKLVLASNIN